MTADDLAPGDVIFVHGTGILDRAIQIAQAPRYGWPRADRPSWWNHAAMVVSDTQVIEARASGIQLWSLGDEDWTTRKVVRPPYQPGHAAEAVAAIRGLGGERYGFLSILSEAFISLGLPLVFGLAHQEICSGAVAYALTRANIDLGDDEEWIRPAGLFAAISHVDGVTLVS